MDFKAIRYRRLHFWQQALLHALVVWLAINLGDAFTYWYRIQTWGNYLVNPDGSFVTQWQRFVNHNYHQAAIPLLLTVTWLVEANYHFVFLRKRLLTFVLSTLAIGFGFLGFFTVTHLLQNEPLPRDLFQPILYLSGYGFLYALGRHYVDQQFRQADRRAQHSEAELTALKAQINPHFFFNTLNNLYGTALEEKASRTAESIGQLAGLMRYLMSEASQDLTPVVNEIRFLEEYLHLQRIRLPERDNIRIQTQWHYDGEPAQIAPLLLIPFVENAFKYGVSVDFDCYLYFRLTVERRRLEMVVENRMLPIRPLDAGQGIGITNARKRLELLYPHRHRLDITEATDQFRVHLQLQLDA